MIWKIRIGMNEELWIMSATITLFQTPLLPLSLLSAFISICLPPFSHWDPEGRLIQVIDHSWYDIKDKTKVLAFCLIFGSTRQLYWLLPKITLTWNVILSVPPMENPSRHGCLPELLALLVIRCHMISKYQRWSTLQRSEFAFVTKSKVFYISQYFFPFLDFHLAKSDYCLILSLSEKYKR